MFGPDQRQWLQTPQPFRKPTFRERLSALHDRSNRALSGPAMERIMIGTLCLFGVLLLILGVFCIRNGF